MNGEKRRKSAVKDKQRWDAKAFVVPAFKVAMGNTHAVFILVQKTLIESNKSGNGAAAEFVGRLESRSTVPRRIKLSYGVFEPPVRNAKRSQVPLRSCLQRREVRAQRGALGRYTTRVKALEQQLVHPRPAEEVAEVVVQSWCCLFPFFTRVDYARLDLFRPVEKVPQGCSRALTAFDQIIRNGAVAVEEVLAACSVGFLCAFQQEVVGRIERFQEIELQTVVFRISQTLEDERHVVECGSCGLSYII
ncbi:hypothetical protein B0H11DRAFT_2127021 [Mycena galericulata]|nr:hypothetical protein B0H11DRAFT_2127021 [Mycena galericulata]